MTAQFSLLSIVGAGPGDPDLLTVKALRRLQEAEVVVYDRLVPAEILALVPRGTARIFAGKSCKQHHMTQDEINALLVTLATSGKRVVRLKGGDPFIFGRGGEEVAHLAAHHIPFEIVPGISAASGCSSYAGIPLTHRGLATGVRYLTGHAQGGEPLALDWAGLADPHTTLVIYMGLANLEEISRKLIEHGLDAQTPTAAIQQGTTSKQKLIISTLGEISNTTHQSGMASPMTIIVGKVVALAEQLAWFDPCSPSLKGEGWGEGLNQRRDAQ